MPRSQSQSPPSTPRKPRLARSNSFSPSKLKSPSKSKYSEELRNLVERGSHERKPPIPSACPKGHVGMCRLQIQYRQGATGLFVSVCNECPRDDRLFDIRGQAPMTLEHLEEIEAVRARDEAAKAAAQGDSDDQAPKHPIKTETADELLVKREPEEEGLIKFEVLPKRERDPPPHLPVDPAENAPPAPSTSTTTRPSLDAPPAPSTSTTTRAAFGVRTTDFNAKSEPSTQEASTSKKRKHSKGKDSEAMSERKWQKAKARMPSVGSESEFEILNVLADPVAKDAATSAVGEKKKVTGAVADKKRPQGKPRAPSSDIEVADGWAIRPSHLGPRRRTVSHKRRQSPTSDIEIISDTHGLVTSGKDRNGVVQARASASDSDIEIISGSDLSKPKAATAPTKGQVVVSHTPRKRKVRPTNFSPDQLETIKSKGGKDDPIALELAE